VAVVEARPVLGHRSVQPAEGFGPGGRAGLPEGGERRRLTGRPDELGGARLQLGLHQRRAERRPVKAAGDPWPIRLQPRQEPLADADASIAKVPIGGIPKRIHSPLRQVGLEVPFPGAEERAHERSPAGGHAPHPGQARPAQKVQEDALDQVVRGVAETGGREARGGQCLIQESIAGGSRRRLERTRSERSAPARADQLDAEPATEADDLGRIPLRARPQRVIEMSRDDRNLRLEEAEQQGSRVGAAGNGDQHAAGVEKTRAVETVDEAGGGGWVRTTDNTIMSRVLYH
jgi:hypothetical protein